MNLTSPQRRLLREADIDNRELERQIAARGGDKEAQSKELVQKMRNGDLTQDQVKLLSYLNYKPAQQLIPVEPPSNDLKEFVNGLEPWGRGALIRAAVVSASSVLHVYEDAYPNDYSPRKAIEAAISGNDVVAAARDASDASDADYVVADTVSYASWAAYSAYYASDADPRVNTRDIIAYSAYSAYYASSADPSLNIRGIIEKELIDWILNA